jgi:hypothetical protein
LHLFYPRSQDLSLIGYADAGYLSDPHNDKSHTSFMFLHGGIAISWKSCKQTLIDMSTNHSKIITLYEAARECAWLCRVINHIQVLCGIEPCPWGHRPLSMKIIRLALLRCSQVI